MALGVPRVVGAYLVKGKEAALIDMGYRSSHETVMRELRTSRLQDGGLDYLLPTHVHLDHAGSCGSLAREFPVSRIIAHPIAVKHLVDPTRLVESATQLFGADLMQQYGLPEPIESSRVRSVSDGEELDLGQGVVLRAIWTPGHAPHQVSYLLEGSKNLFTADAVGIYYPDFPILFPTTPPPSFDLGQAIASLSRLRDFHPEKLLTPHFGVLDDADRWLESNVTILRDWVEKVVKLSQSNASADEVGKIFLERVCEETGRAHAEVPEHVRLSVTVSVHGLLRYAKQRTK